MAIILNIDTATDYGGVGLFHDTEQIGAIESRLQKEHASFLQPAIKKLMTGSGVLLQDIDAVSVTIGPGSYTGLRVGLASAKGLCYALGKPLIAVSTLQVMASAAAGAYTQEHGDDQEKVLFCPMIDARRMEVFSAVYDHGLKLLSGPEALIIDENIYASYLASHTVVFSGNGSVKLKNMLIHPNVLIIQINHNIKHLAQLALERYAGGTFEDLAYIGPFYLKSFYTSMEKK